jgi:hypothetical protein
MISQEAISPCFCNRGDVFPPQVHKVGIISFLGKYILTVITTIVNVIEISVNKRWNVSWHVFIIQERDLTGLIVTSTVDNPCMDLDEGLETLIEDLSGLSLGFRVAVKSRRFPSQNGAIFKKGPVHIWGYPGYGSLYRHYMVIVWSLVTHPILIQRIFTQKHPQIWGVVFLESSLTPPADPPASPSVRPSFVSSRAGRWRRSRSAR